MKAIVLLSGGMDSATCLAKMIHDYGKDQVMAVGFYYGQKHADNHKYAKKIAKYFGVKMINLKIDKNAFNGSNSVLLAKNKDAKIAHESYAEMQKEQRGTVNTYIPFRNGLMLAQTASLAYSQKARYVVYGAHKDDYAGDAYPDCSPAFYKSMNEAIYYGTGKKVKLLAPLINTDKAGTVKLGHKLGVPFEITRTCYEGKDISCGKCATCLDRIEAFKKNGLKDPVPYDIEIDWTDCKNV